MGALKPLCDLLVVNYTKTILDAIFNMLNVSHTHCVYTLSNGQCQYRDIVLLVVNVVSLSFSLRMMRYPLWHPLLDQDNFNLLLLLKVCLLEDLISDIMTTPTDSTHHLLPLSITALFTLYEKTLILKRHQQKLKLN